MGGQGLKVAASSPFMAECMAVKEALLCRNKFSGRHIVIETDCEVLHKMLLRNSNRGCEWESLDLLQEVLCLKESVKDVVFSLVSRQGNSAADVITAGAAEEMYQINWLVCVPSSLCVCI